LGYISVAESLGISLATFTQCAPEANNKCHFAVQGLKVTDFGTNRKLIGLIRLPIVIDTNLPHILHRFQDIAFDGSKIAIFGYPSWVTTPDGTEGFPWNDLRRIFRESQRLAKVPNGVERVEILPKILTGSVVCTNVTDRQTDRQTTNRRQTDGR